MIIAPKIKGFLCITAHPAGCAAEVMGQIDQIKRGGRIPNVPKRVRQGAMVWQLGSRVRLVVAPKPSVFSLSGLP